MPYWITESHDKPGIAYLVQNVQKWIIEPQIDIDGHSYSKHKQYWIIEPWTWSPITPVDQKHKLLIRSRWFFDLSLLKLNDKYAGEDVHAQGVGEVVDFALWFFSESVFSKFEGVLLRYMSRDFRFW